jgi:hypothetical protein
MKICHPNEHRKASIKKDVLRFFKSAKSPESLSLPTYTHKRLDYYFEDNQLKYSNDHFELRSRRSNFNY